MNTDDFHEIKEILKQGGVICYPTETVYGLGCDPFQRTSVERLFQLKKRELYQTPLLLIPNMDWLRQLTKNINSTALRLIETFWPGPLTLVFHASSQVPSWLIRDDESIALRLSAHPWVRAFLKDYGLPLVSTSANVSGCESARSMDRIKEYFPSGLDYIVDGGTLESSMTSTIISIQEEVAQILRRGSLSQEKIEKVLHGTSLSI